MDKNKKTKPDESIEKEIDKLIEEKKKENRYIESIVKALGKKLPSNETNN